jgi:hypothetical protein
VESNPLWMYVRMYVYTVVTTVAATLTLSRGLEGGGGYRLKLRILLPPVSEELGLSFGVFRVTAAVGTESFQTVGHFVPFSAYLLIGNVA